MNSLGYIGAAGLIFLASSSQAADVAGNYQINPAHNGQTKFRKPFHAPLKRKWAVDLGGDVSYPVYGHGRVFVTALTETENDFTIVLFALAADSGAVLWQVEVPDVGAPAYDHGRVFAVNSRGLVMAFNAADGSLAWSAQQQGQSSFDDPITASEGRIYFDGSNSGVSMYGVEEKMGKTIWSQLAPAGDTIPAVSDGRVFATYACNDYAYDAKNGTTLWFYQTGCDGGGVNTPVYFDKLLYVADGGNNVVLDADTGAVVRPFFGTSFAPAFWTGMTSSRSLGFVVDGATKLSAFDTKSGDLIWTTDGVYSSVPPLIVNDTLITGDHAGRLYALDVHTGIEIWSKDIGEGHAIGGSFIFPGGLSAGHNLVFVPAGHVLSAWRSAQE